MNTLEEIKKMQQEGKSEQDIMMNLQSQGIPMMEVSNALAQSKIKQAVGAPAAMDEMPVTETVDQNQDMQPSVLQAENAQESKGIPTPPEPPQEENYQPMMQQQEYQEYQPYVGGINADTIAEIAEQAVNEKLTAIKNKLDAATETKTILETKINYLDERLKRIEKIIDRLQLSILQKVGEYMTNVEDVKKELIETQKSFTSLVKQSPNKIQSKTSKPSE